MSKLIPPDKARCQAERLEGSFMTLGPRSLVRCKNKPVFIAVENAPGEDGQKGSMSLCARCAGRMQEKHGKDFATLIPVEEYKEGVIIAIGPFCWGKGTMVDDAVKNMKKNWPRSEGRFSMKYVELYRAPESTTVNEMGGLTYYPKEGTPERINPDGTPWKEKANARS